MDPSIDITNLFMIINFNIIGKTIKNIIDDIKHQELFLACNPNANILMQL